jgi:membrane protease YdiL (CAAX protease family)
VIYDSLFTWLLVVGISEEIIFRCGVLTLIVGLLAKSRLIGLWQEHPRLSAVILTSFLFALAHLFRGTTLIFLALLASLLYGLAFVAGKSLFGPVLLHGLLNVLILMNFHLSDFK